MLEERHLLHRAGMVLLEQNLEDTTEQGLGRVGGRAGTLSELQLKNKNSRNNFAMPTL